MEISSSCSTTICFLSSFSLSLPHLFSLSPSPFLPPSLYFSLTHPLSLQRYKAELLLISKHVIFCIFFKDFFSSQKGYPHPPIFLTRYFPLPALKCQHSVKDARRIHLGFRRYISRSMLYTSN